MGATGYLVCVCCLRVVLFVALFGVVDLSAFGPFCVIILSCGFVGCFGCIDGCLWLLFMMV